MTKKYKSILLRAFWGVLLIQAPALWAQDITLSKVDTCLLCHGTGTLKPATAIFNTKHASRTDPDSPFSVLQCETCHGPNDGHANGQIRGENLKPTRTFGSNASTPVEEQNPVCLGCHETHGRLGWIGSAHEVSDVACASCHQIHRERDRVFDSVEQQQACFACHPRKRAESLRASSHPLRYGKMACSDCHNPHDGNNDFLLQRATVNETCYTCHAEKRGPFVWEHAPATDDCTLCHQPHGSNHPAMLVKRPPLLCQQCHSPAGHPSDPYSSEEIDDNFSNRFLLGRSCLNCHSNIHGSNHPSGATWTR